MPFLGVVHLFDWDEINFAEAAREMIVSDNYLTVQIDYMPFWEKPPLFIWMQVFSMKLFGINEFAARFPNAVCGIITLFVIFNIGKKLYDKKFGLLWVLAYCGSVLPFFYFKSGIIDPWFNLFIFLGVYKILPALSGASQSGIIINIVLSAVFIGLAVLTKGPVALLIFVLCLVVWSIIKRSELRFSVKNILLFIIILFVTGCSWFILLILNGHFDVIRDSILYQVRLFSTQDAGHGGFFLYHFVILLAGVFPASVFFLRSFGRNDHDSDLQKSFVLLMKILFWVVLILFTIVRTKIVHYSSLCYFPMTFLCTLVIYKIIKKEYDIPDWLKAGVVIIGAVMGVAVILLQFAGQNSEWMVRNFMKNDEFAAASMQADVFWSGVEFIPGLVLLCGLIFFLLIAGKKGFQQGLVILFSGSLIFIYLTMVQIVPRIEKYSQNAAIEFYKEHSDEDCYIETLGFKSYAHLFYAGKQPVDNKMSYDKMWLLGGDIDKQVYFVSKINKVDKYLSDYPYLEILYEKNGFVFLERKLD